MSKELSEYLWENLRARSLSMRDVARYSNGAVSFSSVQRALDPDPDKPASWQALAAIAETLNLNPIILFRKAGLLAPEPNQTVRERELLQEFRQLPSEHQGFVVAFVLFLSRYKQFPYSPSPDE